MRILLVDDDPEIVEVYRMYLSGKVEILSAGDGEAALALLAKEKVDVIVTDIRMPRMDGVTLMRAAKKLQPGVRVILVSGFLDAVDEARRLGEADEVVAKPFNVSKLLELVRKS